MKDEATGRGPDGKSVYSYENMQEGLKYLSKDNVGEGMAFLSGHLEFVSALFKGVELQERLERLGGLRGVGFADLVSSVLCDCVARSFALFERQCEGHPLDSLACLHALRTTKANNNPVYNTR